MSRKSKVDPVFKIKAVEDILTGRSSIRETAQELNVDKSTIIASKIEIRNATPLSASCI